MKLADKILAVSAIISGVLIILHWSFFFYIWHRYNTIIKSDTASLGIISSSDGPTSIIISGTAGEFISFTRVFPYITLTISVGIIIIRIFQRNCKK